MRMNILFSFAGVALVSIIAFGLFTRCSQAQHLEENLKDRIYDYTVSDINGKSVSLSAYEGKVMLIVNVASKCGFTPQYEGLEMIYREYKQDGFVILGFPANNFLGQEPGTANEIKTFCSTTYNVTFPLFAKISVKGKDQAPLYTFLTAEQSNPTFKGAIGWNFTKFLVNRKGEIVARFEPKVEPTSDVMRRAIEDALSEE